MNDLVGEALRPVYGRAPIVIASHAGADAPDRRLTDRFEHVVFVDVPESDDDAEVAEARQSSVGGAVRTAPAHQRVRRPIMIRPSTMGSAA